MGCIACKSTPIIIVNNNHIENSNSHHSKSKDNYEITNNSALNINLSFKHGNKIKISTSKMIRRTMTKIEENFKVISLLGKGTFGSVYKVLSIKDDKIRAMKIIKKESIKYQDDDKKFLKEIEILIQTDHPHIIKIFEYFMDDVNYYLITEFVSGGTLYDTITNWQGFDEFHVATILYQLLSAVNYLHSLGIVHRDIKPENILFENITQSNLSGNNNQDNIIIKLIDFGTCNYVSNSTKLTHKVGTPYYIAPEVLARKYDLKADVWSCGVILYILLCGYPPFDGDNALGIMESVKKGQYSMNSPHWENVPPEAKDLVVQMLEYNPDHRISANDALHHHWIVSRVEKTKTVCPYSYINVLNNIQSFNAKEKFQQATLAYIVHFYHKSAEIGDLRAIFQEFDKNGDGRISYEELTYGFEKVFGKPVSHVRLREIFEEMDHDQNELIEYQEFLRVGLNKKELLSEENLKLAFDKMDENRDGKLSIDEIKNALGTTDNDYAMELMEECNKKVQREIGYEEYIGFMKQILVSSKGR